PFMTCTLTGDNAWRWPRPRARSNRISSCTRPDQSKSSLLIMHFLEVRGGLGQNHFKGRTDVALLQMSGERRSIALADNDVYMQRWLARRRKRHITDERSKLDLFFDDVAE